MPPSPQKNYYDVLGVPRTASVDEIKKRYRTLARELHPDVNRHNADASRRFSEVTEAYKALSDADSRKAHDAELSLREQQAARAAARHNAYSPGGAASRTAGTTGAAGGARPAAGTGRPAGGAASAEVARLIAEAQAAFVRGKLVEARAYAEQARRLNHRNPQPYEILGDVYRMQGRTEQAIQMYSMALQINPRNTSVMHRLERLSRGPGGGSGSAGGGRGSAQRVYFDNRDAYANRGGGGPAGAEAASGRPSPSAAPPGAFSSLPHEKRPVAALLVGVFGYGLTFLLILFAALNDARPWREPPLPMISEWNGTVMAVLALCGALLGATMTITHAIRRVEDELIFAGGSAIAGSGRGGVPIGLLLIVVSFLSFYAAAMLYAIIGFLQEAITPSMLRVFGAVIAVTLMMAMIYEPGRGQLLLYGPNVVFLSLILGWFLGDFFRSDAY